MGTAYGDQKTFATISDPDPDNPDPDNPDPDPAEVAISAVAHYGLLILLAGIGISFLRKKNE